MDEQRLVSPEEAQRLLREGALLLDVRNDDEWAEGRAPGAMHVALADLPDHVNDFDATRMIVCVCRSGGRSHRAALFLMEHGLTAANLDGGMLAWAEAGGPLESDGGEPTVA
ncbi:MAG TPA: rhodanese-like domain-containing protein [Acidimicrobiales bacterium]|nr:rhodanese-like domain-containing protein [Acidimicrobiales bacterium]